MPLHWWVIFSLLLCMSGVFLADFFLFVSCVHTWWRGANVWSDRSVVQAHAEKEYNRTHETRKLFRRKKMHPGQSTSMHHTSCTQQFALYWKWRGITNGNLTCYLWFPFNWIALLRVTLPFSELHVASRQ